ncbi:MAG TPA: cytochrome b/b6 domain-containing protein [Chloroflexota bacterium]|nr:cytochrome b/b6 domain-containing protein [Chloroflexota bacterium]
MSRSAAPRPLRVLRFDGAERFVHWAHAFLFLLLVLTGALLIWVDWLRAIAIGPYRVLPLAHELLGVALLVTPFLPALRRRGASLTADLFSLVRWRAPRPKFNPGQRLNALFTLVAMFGLGLTGVVIWLGRAVPYWVQEPAYEWHAFLALLAFVVFLGHLLMALTHPRSLRAMLTGWLESPDEATAPKARRR